jgi:hypothetical protein
LNKKRPSKIKRKEKNLGLSNNETKLTKYKIFKKRNKIYLNPLNFLLRYITYLFNCCLKESIVPDEWKTAIVTPLYERKEDNTDMNNYRGISILPFMSKLFEKLVAKQIFTYFEENNLFYCNDTNENSPANLFVDTLANSFLTQFVTHPTFQTDHHTTSNTLDLVIAESSDRIDEIAHYPPFSSLRKAHQVLKWSYRVRKSDRTTSDKTVTRRIYARGNYARMNVYFDSID